MDNHKQIHKAESSLSGQLIGSSGLTGQLSGRSGLTGQLSGRSGLTGQLSTIINVVSYKKLLDKPRINEHILNSGENTLNDLGIGLATNIEIDYLFR